MAEIDSWEGLRGRANGEARDIAKGTSCPNWNLTSGSDLVAKGDRKGKGGAGLVRPVLLVLCRAKEGLRALSRKRGSGRCQSLA